MKFLEKRILRGPSIHSTTPCFLAVIDLEDLDERASNTIPGFVDKLVALLPGLNDHRCSLGYRGGFVERLHEGTYPAHITEHVLIELQNMAGIDVGYGKARKVKNRDRQYTIVCSYKIEKVGQGQAKLAAAKTKADELRGQLDAEYRTKKAEIDAFETQPVERVMQRLGERLTGVTIHIEPWANDASPSKVELKQ